MYKNILYDFDGTLVDTAPDILDCLKRSYKLVLRRDVKISRKIIGPPLTKMIEKLTPGLADEQIAEIVMAFRKLYDNNNFTKTNLFPEVKKLLKYFQKIAVKQFIVTNKPAFITDLLIKKFEIPYFLDVINYDSFPNQPLSKPEMVEYLIKKYHISPQESLLVGDAVSDISAAKDNGLRSASILAGYGTEEEIRDSQPDYIFKSMSDFYHNFNQLERAK